MSKIEITGEKLEQIMKLLPDEGRIVFEKLLLQAASIQPLKDIKHWIDNFEADCPVDNLIARIAAQAIHDVGHAISKDMDERIKAKGKTYSGHDAAEVAIAQLRKMADQLQAHLSHDTCGKCCGTTH